MSPILHCSMFLSSEALSYLLFPFTLSFSIWQPGSSCYSQVAAEDADLAVWGPLRKSSLGPESWSLVSGPQHAPWCMAVYAGHLHNCAFHIPHPHSCYYIGEGAGDLREREQGQRHISDRTEVEERPEDLAKSSLRAQSPAVGLLLPGQLTFPLGHGDFARPVPGAGDTESCRSGQP